jgi:hypothetical protein
MPCGGFQLAKWQYKDVSFGPKDSDEIEEISLLALGAMGLYLRTTFDLSKKTVGHAPRQRLSDTRVRTLWDTSLLVWSVKRVLKDTIPRPYQLGTALRGRGFVLIKYLPPYRGPYRLRNT